MREEIQEKLEPDGSDRCFFRIKWKDSNAIRILPSKNPLGLKEARAFYKIGSHLYKKSVHVPKIFNYCQDTGELIVEDLGDVRLQDIVNDLVKKERYEQVTLVYKKVLDHLALMQINGAKDFDTSWCWQSPFYDSKLAKEKEVKYFLSSFVKDFCGCIYSHHVEHELFSLAASVDDFLYKSFFLHRDFQSRNIMWFKNEPFIIDFQGGRIGPMGYDLASLLYDPYVSVPEKIRRECLNYYLNQLRQQGFLNLADEIQETFSILCSLRLLQALGAYGFLIKVKDKSFFKPYIKPALEGLRKHLIIIDCYLRFVKLNNTIKFLERLYTEIFP